MKCTFPEKSAYNQWAKPCVSAPRVPKPALTHDVMEQNSSPVFLVVLISATCSFMDQLTSESSEQNAGSSDARSTP